MYTAMSTRPGRPSIFLRDEFSGLLEAMLHKDYMAGFPEMLTKLYDGKLQKRILRKETIEVKSPCLILYTGGIRSKVQDTLTLEEVASGFLPRFIFITAESDVSKVQPLGPPTEKNWGARDVILNELKEIGLHYTGFHQEKVNDKLITTPDRKIWTAELTPQAWERYNALETQMMLDGVNSIKPEVFTPVWDRLCKSILKSAMLIAASKQRDSERVVVEEIDLIHAIYYGEQWRSFARQIIVNVGHSKDERRIQTILNAIKRNGGTAPRTQLMQSYHLHGREAQDIFATLEQRGLITRTRMGKTEMITLEIGDNNAD
jgi:predicted transcriptional regulator